MYKIHNVLSNQERKKLIKDCQPLLQDLGEEYPGKQTNSLLHFELEFVSVMKKILDKQY